MPASIYILGAIIGWSLWGLFSKLAMNHIHPIMFQFISYCFACILGLIYFFIIQKNNMKWELHGVWYAIIAAIFTSIAVICFSFAVQQKQVSAVIPITSTYPVFVSILAVIFLGETFTINKLFGLFLTLAGVWIINR